MARKGRQTKSFMVIRRGPLFADEFNCSLDAWQLSREAMLEARFEKQGKVDRKEKGRETKVELPSTQLTHKVLGLESDETINDAVKQLCQDIIIVATHKVELEDEKATVQRPTNNNTDYKLDQIQYKGRRDGDVVIHDTPPKAKVTYDDQTTQIDCYDSEEILHQRAKLICLDAIGKAVYRVSKVNLELVQNAARSSILDTTKTELNSNVVLESASLSQKGVSKRKKNELKILRKARRKEETQLRKYQEKTVKAYIKMVEEKYRERNKINGKAWTQQMKDAEKEERREKKELQKVLKKEKKEQKMKERNMQKKKMVKRGKVNRGESLDMEHINDGDDNARKLVASNGCIGNQKSGFMGRIGQLFRCVKVDKEIPN